MVDIIYTEGNSEVVIVSDQQETVITQQDLVSVIEKDIDPIVHEISTEAGAYIEIVTQEQPIAIIESLLQGPQGPQGIPGRDGLSTLIPGTFQGDFLRWNANSEAWEVASEPIEFNQIVLTPTEVATLNKEGAMWYSSIDKSVHVCTDI